jgi:hypothetical protein
MVKEYQNKASVELEEMSEGDLQHVTGGAPPVSGVPSSSQVSQAGRAVQFQAQKISEGTAYALTRANRAAQDAKTLEKVREWQGWKALPFDGITKFPVT